MEPFIPIRGSLTQPWHVGFDHADGPLHSSTVHENRCAGIRETTYITGMLSAG
jgi:hypothetical protein